MKHTKLFLILVLFLTACTAPATEVPTSTPTFTLEPASPTSAAVTPTVTVTPTMTVTPDPAMGSMEGNLSWLLSSTSASLPIEGVILEVNGHSGDLPRYKVRADQRGHFSFSNIAPGDYGFGIYLNLQLSERQCEVPEYIYSQDLKWLHYATGLKVNVWYDILFSSVDVTVNPGEVVVLDFVLKCP